LPEVSPAAASVDPSSSEQHLPCIINWTDAIARAEDDLAFAVVVTVIGDEPLAEANMVAAAIAARLVVAANSLVLRRASASSYLLILPDLGSMDFLVGLQ
jgi:hypothetical protein